VIVAAAICPSPPLLASRLTGQADILPELRAASAAAVGRLVAAAADVVAVVGPAEATGPWNPDGQLDLASFAPALRRGRPLAGHGERAGQTTVAPSLPLALGVGALLLDAAGYTGPRSLHGVAEDEQPAACLALGRRIAASAPRVALLAVGDGSARRSESAPGYLDERAAPFDEAVTRAVRDGDLPAIAALDPVLAADLLAAGRPAWQALAGALAAGHPPAPRRASGEQSAGFLAADRPRTEILYSDAPLGVAYLVATLTP
jgi:hypothetical protein